MTRATDNSTRASIRVLFLRLVLHHRQIGKIARSPEMRERLASLPRGCLLVLRAYPAAAGARQADLAADLDLVIGRLLRRQVGALRQE